MQNVYVMYMKISYKFHRIHDTQSRVITKVYDFLGQPSYMHITWERSGSVVECSTPDLEVAGSSLTRVTALCSLKLVALFYYCIVYMCNMLYAHQ